MAVLRFTGIQKATALVPLALLSTAWTANLVAADDVTPVAASSESPSASSLPDGTSVPSRALEAPASVTTDGIVAPGLDTGGDATTVVDTASTYGIPSAALAAYQRAEAIINSADRACNLDWELLAAIGRVESDHGRYGGNVLDADGVATPGIFGIALNGKRNTQPISDTDAGQYDGDTRWDRAVGPMQFIPSTWSVVGVDADGDGTRNPQDIDDAALASAVYLCSGSDDLSTDTGRRAAVYRYNHSDQYVDLVLSLRDAYLTGDFTAVPNNTTSASTFTPNTFGPTRGQQVPGEAKDRKDKQRGKQQARNQDTDTQQGSQPQPSQDPTTEPSPTPTPTPTPSPAPKLPTKKDLPLNGDPGKEAGDKGIVKGLTKDPVEQLDDTVKDPVGEVEETLTEAEARAQCLAKGISALNVPKLLKCIAGLVK